MTRGDEVSRTLAADSSVADEALRPTAAPPWLPARPVPAQEPWELAVRAPERIVTLPLSALAYVAKNTTRVTEQRQLIDRFAGSAAGAGRPRLGLSVGAPHLGPAVGLGLAVDFKPSLLQSAFSAHLAGSTKKYTRTLLALHRGPAMLHYEYDWRPRDRFFGYGLGSANDSSSSFAWRQQRFQLTLIYPWQQTHAKPRLAQVQGWIGPREIVIRHGRLAPSFEQTFPGQAGLLNLRQERLVYGLQLVRDSRVGEPHWLHGVRTELRAERFDKAIDALTLRSAHTEAPQFTRLSFRGQTGFSFMRDPRTFRVAVRAVSTGPVAGSAPLLIPDLVSLGADDGLASLALGRFRDRDLLYGAASYIFPLSRQLEMELHSETGGVYARMRDAKPSSFKQSYGFSLRPRTDLRVLGAVGADWSPGAFVIRYSLGGEQ